MFGMFGPASVLTFFLPLHLLFSDSSLVPTCENKFTSDPPCAERPLWPCAAWFIAPWSSTWTCSSVSWTEKQYFVRYSEAVRGEPLTGEGHIHNPDMTQPWVILHSPPPRPAKSYTQASPYLPHYRDWSKPSAVSGCAGGRWGEDAGRSLCLVN